jgi:vacuolar-type H+-ATPase catalytic subunit A/Vma1
MSYEDKIKEQAQPYLLAGERVLAAFIARPRGATTAAVGGLGAGLAGGRKIGQQNQAAQEAGLRLANPMALALTGSRLLVLQVSPPIALGKGGDVKDLVSSAPLADVESIGVKRLLVGKVVTVSVRGRQRRGRQRPGRGVRAG